ncbi:MAG: putative O-linked N-acetylglucosamine transferase, SPINDLY family [Candidatus Accumulibacter appositus]|uniref:Putative O-linked N-acetylglucosamine transferase, SPINDLY family n=1 Tax=Candidatus Accumulibacter appositus TaxID=1454003 RepID=A0A011PMX1_9PROT|nr:hypothetical protein [Accumulibacter sp.]EXI78210.1 MAG: putative O-linked N-acetylglucosamine transferase, SPINDLY family [Candidatus Accumulibacter appositus]HRF04662.1 hypothetical protein [Accumulibacter sp.]
MSHDRINKSDPSPAHEASRIEDLERTCFVIMPFGLKEVAGRKVDFTAIYEKLFEPAINAARTPEGEALIPKRTDMEAFAGSINQDMFEYIMYSRLAFADISGLNPNVFYEIGARHATQEAGTVIFRQQGHSIPFDIATIKVFEYCDPTIPEAGESRDFITKVLTDTLKRNRLDSPVRLALRSQWSGQAEPPRHGGASPSAPDQSNDPLRPHGAASQAALQALQSEWRKQEVENLMRDAEEAVRVNELESARIHYWAALRFDATNLLARMRLGLVLKQQGRNYEALEEFTTLSKLAPDYAEAWKEKGIAEGLIARMIPAEQRKKASWMPDGSTSLQRATRLNPNDFDAWASLGGVESKVRKDPDGAYRMYMKAAEVSDGHPYPLLNAIKLEAARTGKIDLAPLGDRLERAESMRKAQAQATPPADPPWCFYDLAEIHLYRREQDGFITHLEAGIKRSTATWQIESFRNTLQSTLVDHGIDLPGLSEGILLLDKAIEDQKERERQSS